VFSLPVLGHDAFHHPVLPVLGHFWCTIKESITVIGVQNIPALPVIEEKAEGEVAVVERVIIPARKIPAARLPILCRATDHRYPFVIDQDLLRCRILANRNL